MNIPVKDIYYDGDNFNSRREFTLQSVKDLSESIAEVGLISPVVIQPWGKDGFKFRLLVGHRRFRATTMFLRWIEIPAIIESRPLTDHQARLLNFSENSGRKDLSIMEEAWAVQRMYPKGTEITLRAIAKELKKSVQWVVVRQRLLLMSPKIQALAHAGLSAINLLEISRMPPEDQLFAAEKIADARARSKNGKFLPGLTPKLRSKRDVRKRGEINPMVEKLFEMGITGFPCRCLVWAANQISTDDLLADARKLAQENQ